MPVDSLWFFLWFESSSPVLSPSLHLHDKKGVRCEKKDVLHASSPQQNDALKSTLIPMCGIDMASPLFYSPFDKRQDDEDAEAPAQLDTKSKPREKKFQPKKKPKPAAVVSSPKPYEGEARAEVSEPVQGEGLAEPEEGETDVELEEDTWATGDTLEGLIMSESAMARKKLSMDTNGRRFSLFEDCEVIPTVIELSNTMAAVGQQMQQQLDAQKEQLSKLMLEMKRQKNDYEAEIGKQKLEEKKRLKQEAQEAQQAAQQAAEFEETLEGHEEAMMGQLKMITSHEDQGKAIRMLKLEIQNHRAEMEKQQKTAAQLSQKTMVAMDSMNSVAQKMRQALLGQRKQIQQLYENLKKTQKELDDTKKALKTKEKDHGDELAKIKAEIGQLKREMNNKVGLSNTFVIRTLNTTAIQAHQRFWKGEKMVIDRFEAEDARDPEDWRQ
eukprot:g15146.t1